MTAAAPDHNAFLRAVLARPDDSLPRLVMADWLDENASGERCPQCDGDGYTMAEVQVHIEHETCSLCHGRGRTDNGYAARAEFIRVQVELAGLPAAAHCLCGGRRAVPGEFCSVPECRPCALRRRERESLKAHEQEWVNDLWRAAFGRVGADIGYEVEVGWQGGFIGALTIGSAAFLARAAALFAAAPVTRVVLSGKQPYRLNPGFRWNRSGLDDEGVERAFPGYTTATVPAPLFDRLSGPDDQPWLYPTEAAALTDLSAACVSWAREQASLPPLPARRREAARA